LCFSFLQTMIDIFKILICFIDQHVYSKELEKNILNLVVVLMQKLVKKMNSDCLKISYIEFKLLKSVVRLEAKIIHNRHDHIFEIYQEMLSDMNQQFDFHHLYCLQMLSAGLNLTSTDLKEEDTVQAPANLPTPAFVKDTTNLDILLEKMSVVGTMPEMREELKRKLIRLQGYVYSFVHYFSNHASTCIGLIKNGTALSCLSQLLEIYLFNPKLKNLTVMKLAKEAAMVLRNVLIFGSEATIKYFGEANCLWECSLRGERFHGFQKSFEVFISEEAAPLVEFFRILRKLVGAKMIERLIGGYNADTNEQAQIKLGEEFVKWLLQQNQANEPNFIWNSACAQEVKEIVQKQENTIVYSCKVNYSFYLDEFKSKVLSEFTKLGDFYLENLINSENYKILEGEKMVKMVRHLANF
jgi:hypothetical protein